MRGWGAVALLVVLLAVGCALALPVSSSPSHLSTSARGSAVGWINISAVGDYGYSPANLEQVPTDATITVKFTDQSPMAHTFTILGKEGWVVPTTDSQAQIDQLAYGGSPPALVESNVSGPGIVNVTSFVSPGPGWYEFVCTVTGHFQLGMYGFIAFGMNLPSNLTASNRTGIGGPLNFSPLDAAVLGVVLVACVAGYVVWRRRQARARNRP